MAADTAYLSLSSVYKEIKNLSGQTLDEILQIIKHYAHECEVQEVERRLYEDNASALIMALTPKYLARLDECLETMNVPPTAHIETNQPAARDETKSPVIPQKRKPLRPEQIFILEREFAQSRSLSTRRCEEISEIINVSSKLVKLWFKKRRLGNESQPPSKGTVKLTLRLKKQSEDTNTWSVLQQNTNDCSMSAAKSLVCSGQQGLANALKLENLEVTDETPLAKPATTRLTRMKVNAEQQNVLETAFLESQFCAGKRRKELAEQLGLPAKQIGNWFEYRRRRIREQERRAKLDGSNESVSTTSIQLKHVDAPVVVKQESFETLPLYSSTPARVWSSEDYDSQSSGYGSTFSSESSSSKQSPTPEEISLWLGRTEEVDFCVLREN